MDNNIFEKINRMTLEQKIGQLIVGQAEGYEMSPEFEDYIRNYPLCGYRISGQNIKNKNQIKAFTSAITDLYSRTGAGIVPLLASDQEGGSLSVFGKLMTEFPGNMSLGAAGEPEFSYLQGNVSGNELSDMGINMAFAPVADLNLQINNPVIGVRSFGDNAEKVSELCKKYAVGLNSGGVTNCAKHFPGHGNTNIDSHKALPSNLSSLELFSKTELVPFSKLVKEKVDSIMVSHVLYPSITEDSIPASLSEKIINGILRKQLKYEGVVMTDDLEMKAVTAQYELKQAAPMFILAGGDILLINGTREGVIEALDSLKSAVLEGIIGIDRINQSVYRILQLKEKAARYYGRRKARVENPVELSKEISRKAITLVRDEKGILPFKQESKILLIVPEQVNLTEADTTGGMENRLYKYISSICQEVKLFKTVLGKESDMNGLLRLAQDCDYIVQCTINCARFPEQIKILEQLCSIKPTAVLMLRDPYDLIFFKKDVTVIAAYSAIDTNMEVTCSLLSGKYDFKGTLPVSL